VIIHLLTVTEDFRTMYRLRYIISDYVK